VFPVLPQLREGAGAVLFCCAALFFAVGTVLDYVAISEKNSTALVVRNVVLTGLRIPLLFVPWLAFGGDGTHILAAWTIAAGLSMLVSLLSFRRSPLGRTLRPDFGRTVQHIREMGASFLGQHLITVAAMLAGYLLPIMVLARLSATDNGYFYITWMLGSIFFMISPAISTSLFAEGATNPDQLPALVRRCLLFSGGLLVLPMLAYLFGGGLLLGLFGPDYIEHGRALLVLLTLSAIPDAVTNIAVAVLRATGRLNHAFALNASMLVLCLIGSWLLLPHLGIIAVGACWLGCQLLGAVYAVMRRRTVFRAPSR
jgi:O-antigen/teichoic acid export membrane protein